MAVKKKNLEQVLQKFPPAIFIGLGGSGTTVIGSLREKSEQKFQEERPDDWQHIVNRVFQFIAIDSIPERTGGALGIPKSNYHRFGGFDGRVVISDLKKTDSSVNLWWPEKYPSCLLDKGAGQVRVNGRLCLLDNISSARSIVHTINNACSIIGDIFNEQVQQSDVGTFAVNIYLFCSMAGGTGSGTFIDLAYLVRRNLPDGVSPRVILYLLTSEVIGLVAPGTSARGLMANSYAALRELNFWQNPNRGRPYSWEGLPSGKSLPESERPFDLVHIIHPVNEAGKAILDFTTVHKLVADMCFYDAMLPQSAYQEDQVRNNIYNFYDMDPTLEEEYPITYGSGSIATMRVPVEKILNYWATAVLPELLRTYVWKEPEHQASIEAESFWKEKARIDPKVLQNKIAEHVDCPRPSRRYRLLIDGAGRKTLASAVQDSKKDMQRYESIFASYLEGEEGQSGQHEQLLSGFENALDQWVKELLGRPEKNRIGLLAQSIEIVIDKTRGVIRRDGDTLGFLLQEFREAKREEKEAENRIERAYQEAYHANVFKKAARKDDLKTAFNILYNAKQRRLVLEESIRLMKSFLERMQQLKSAIRFLRKQVVNPIFEGLEEEKEQVWTKTEYDDERGGIVIEVLDQEWAENALRTMLEDDNFIATVIERMRSEIINLCTAEIKRTWERLSFGDSIDSVIKDRGIAAKVEIRMALLESSKTAFSEELERRYSGLTIWHALEQEARFKLESCYEEENEILKRIGKYINERIHGWSQKASCWWPVSDAQLAAYKLYEQGKVKTMGILRSDISTANAFQQKYGLSLEESVGLDAKSCGSQDSKDPQCFQIIYFKYGAPLFLLRLIERYKTEHNLFKQYSPKVPLYTDKRYDEDWNLPDPAKTPGEEKRTKVKTIFMLSETVTFPGEEGPRIRRDSAHVNYTFDLPPKVGLNQVAVKGRKAAQEALYNDNFRDGSNRYKIIYRDLKEYWNALSEKDRIERLEAVREYLGKWIKEIGDRSGRDAIQRSLLDILKDDHAVIDEMLESGSYVV